MRNNEIEAQAVYQYLSAGLSPSSSSSAASSPTAQRSGERAADIAIDIMRRNWNNPAYRPLKSIRKLGPLIIFIKRLIRRCVLKWYVEPICAQQAIFNEAALRMSVVLNEESIQQRADILELNARLQQQRQETSDLTAVLTASMNEQAQRFADLNAGLTQQIAAVNADISHYNQWAAGVNANAREHIRLIGALEADGRQQRSKITELEQQLLRQNERLLAAQDQLSQLESYGVFSEKHPSYEKQSFSQTGEDMILSFIFSEMRIPLSQVFYLDLGANHAKLISNTYYFYRQGARGVLVEANPALVPELRLYRSGDVVLNRCIADKSGEKIPFYIIGNGDGLSTADRESAESFVTANAALSLERVVEVETITVTEIIDRYFDGAPVLLNVDIEGKEEEVLRGIDFTRCRPAVIVCEMIPYDPNALHTTGQKNTRILAIMAENGYAEYAFTGINAIFIDKKRLRGEQT